MNAAGHSRVACYSQQHAVLRMCTERGTLRVVQVRMATFSQHHVDGLDLALTPLQAMMRTFTGVKDEPLRFVFA